MIDDIRDRFKSKSTNGSSRPKKLSQKNFSSKIQPKIKDKNQSKPNIFSIWDDQRRMDAEEKKIAQELAETKRKAKELQRTLRAHRFGETKIKIGSKSKAVIQSGKSRFSKSKSWLVSNKKKSSILALAIAVSVLLISVFINNKSQTDTLGESVNITSKELPKEKPDFALLYPSNSSEESYEVVRNNPQGSAPSYVYLDKFNEEDVPFQVTQQLVPDNFDLEKTAKDFQATSIIQIDESKVYHGYAEKAAIQSLLFIKDGKLILIASPKKHPDDLWANYILLLK